jgi:ribulose-5-phosphate 4-epimerase/fuculose-1-phosphate aldolase
MLAEAVVSLGPEIPMVPYFRPGDPALTDAIGEALQRADVIILERHGVLAVGGGFEQAYLRMELLEHQAKIALNAATLGAVRQLPPEEVAALSKKGRPASSPAREHDGEVPALRRTPVPGASTAPNVGSLVDQALKRFS